jgi:diketogulonate reductase-like aldo/keto reductase
MKLPLLGLGTWDLRGHECTETVKKALEVGYRHIDTSIDYENQEAIKKAIKGFDRKQLFITSKFELDMLDLKKIAQSVEETCDLVLKQLGTDYVDLYLIHWPKKALPMTEVFKAVEMLVKKGKIKKAGVSNFTIHHLENLLNDGCKPAANQVEFHPYLYQKELWEYCKTEQIQLIAYRPFGKGAILKDPVLKKIGTAHGKNTAQALIRWFIQKEIPTIPKASSEKHLAENFAVFDFELSEKEMHEIDKLNQNKRFCNSDDAEFDY